jgi:hypothetical protein
VVDSCPRSERDFKIGWAGIQKLCELDELALRSHLGNIAVKASNPPCASKSGFPSTVSSEMRRQSDTTKGLIGPISENPHDIWLPPRDSNPDKQIQNLLSYR